MFLHLLLSKQEKNIYSSPEGTNSLFHNDTNLRSAASLYHLNRQFVPNDRLTQEFIH